MIHELSFRMGIAFSIETLRERKERLISKQTHDDSQRAFELINMIDEINARLKEFIFEN